MKTTSEKAVARTRRRASTSGRRATSTPSVAAAAVATTSYSTHRTPPRTFRRPDPLNTPPVTSSRRDARDQTRESDQEDEDDDGWVEFLRRRRRRQAQLSALRCRREDENNNGPPLTTTRVAVSGIVDEVTANGDARSPSQRAHEHLLEAKRRAASDLLSEPHLTGWRVTSFLNIEGDDGEDVGMTKAGRLVNDEEVPSSQILSSGEAGQVELMELLPSQGLLWPTESEHIPQSLGIDSHNEMGLADYDSQVELVDVETVGASRELAVVYEPTPQPQPQLLRQSPHQAVDKLLRKGRNRPYETAAQPQRTEGENSLETQEMVKQHLACGGKGQLVSRTPHRPPTESENSPILCTTPQVIPRKRRAEDGVLEDGLVHRGALTERPIKMSRSSCERAQVGFLTPCARKCRRIDCNESGLESDGDDLYKGIDDAWMGVVSAMRRAWRSDVKNLERRVRELETLLHG